MENLIDVAYNTAVQRLDRAMLANQIHYRTPFIDAQVMALALQLPVRWKIHEVEGEPVEKYILREAFRDILPEQIYKRRKLRFSAGTGTDGFMDRVAEGQDEAADFSEATQHTPEGYTLNSPKELWYYRLFKEHFPEPAFERLVGRWDPDK
jgi:asparagine synthase (glutamine-hydrolysing)